jgi:peroxiredoxin
MREVSKVRFRHTSVICIALVLLLVLAAACDNQPAAPGFKRGQPAPDFTLSDISGNTFTLSAKRGSVVLLNFWLPGSDDGRTVLNEIAAALVRLKARGLVALTVAPGGTERAVRQAISGQPYTWPFAVDSVGELNAVYGLGSVTAFPVCIFITPSGKYDSMHTGLIDRLTIEQAFGFAQRGN